MKTGKAAVFTGVDQDFEIREFPLTEPTAGMARMKLIASGICGTDGHIHRGKIPLEPPKIIGHEFVGRVEALSAEDSQTYGIQPGDAVIVDIACPCGECLLCRQGDDANCLNMGLTNGGDPSVPPHFYGGYGEYNYSPVKNLIRIPAELDPEMTCVFACAGPTSLHAFSLAGRGGADFAGARVAVVQGLGPVGVFTVMYLAALGIPHIVAIVAGNSDGRADLARRLGATDVFSLAQAGPEAITAHIQELSGGIGADVVIEASGSPAAVPMGLALLRNRGVYLVPGQYSNSGGIEIQPQMITFKALQIIGSSQYSVQDVRNYLLFLQAHPELHAGISALAGRYRVAEINRAFREVKDRACVKMMLTP